MHHFRTVESNDLETDVLKQLTTFFMTSNFFWGPFSFIDHGNIYTIKIMSFVCPKHAYLPSCLPFTPCKARFRSEQLASLTSKQKSPTAGQSWNHGSMHMEADNTWRPDVPGTQGNGLLRRQLAEGPALGTLPYEGVIPHNNLAEPVFIFVVIPSGYHRKKGKVFENQNTHQFLDCEMPCISRRQ